MEEEPPVLPTPLPRMYLLLQSDLLDFRLKEKLKKTSREKAAAGGGEGASDLIRREQEGGQTSGAQVQQGAALRTVLKQKLTPCG